jgi:hypothetical protein
LLFNMTERSKSEMQWSERYGYDKHPEEYSGKNGVIPRYFLLILERYRGHRELLADAEYERQNTSSCPRFPSVVEAKKRQTPSAVDTGLEAATLGAAALAPPATQSPLFQGSLCISQIYRDGRTADRCSAVATLYEVVDLEPGHSMTVRDVILGGDPVSVEEKLGSQSAARWDRIAGRIVTFNGKRYFTGALLLFPHHVADDVLSAVDRMAKRR